MPLVLTQNEGSAAAVTYNDELGTSYEFPARYQKLVQPGEPFVYYRGKRSATGGTQIPHYFGAGVVGVVTPTEDGRLRCTINQYRAFRDNVPLKRDGLYLEPGANGRPLKEIGLHFRTGVRAIDQKSFDAILAAGGLSDTPMKKAPVKSVAKKSVSGPAQSGKDKMHDLAVGLATTEAKSQWPSARIFRAPAGQHFSIIVRHASGEKHHIAVKSTTETEPHVKLSQGEVAYARTHASTYSLWVFYHLDLDAGTGKLIKRKGKITDDDVDLEAAIHGGRLKNVKSGKNVGPL